MRITAAFRAMGETIEALAPDAVVVVGADHGRIYGFDGVPQFLIGVGATAAGIGDAALPECEYAVHQPTARAVLDGLLARDIDIAFSESVRIDSCFVRVATPSTTRGKPTMAPSEEGSLSGSAVAGWAGEGYDNIRRPIEEARHVPGAFYCSPEIYELEKRNIFMKDWLCVARVEELEDPGDYMAIRVMGEPAIVVRGDDGELRAFSNTCAHRGVEVIRGEGNTGHFSCPYHGWSYDLEGALTGAAFMEDSEEFDPARCGLPPLRLGTWAGWVFVAFDDDAPPLADFVAHFEREFGFLRQEDCRLAVKLEVELDCNWKLFVENLLDVYHAATLHAKTIGARRGRADRYPFNLFERGGTSMFYHSAPMVPGGKSLFGKMPWLDDRPDNFACSGRLSPNMQLIARSDNVHPFVMWPLGPDRCRVVNYTLFPEPHFELPGFEEKIAVYRDYLIDVVEEDREMVASLQRNMKSPRQRPGPMSKLELGIQHVIADLLDRVRGSGGPG